MNTKLAAALKFNEADLEANREGHITHEQSNRLLQSIRREIVITWEVFIIFILVLFFASANAPLLGNRTSTDKTNFIQLIVIVTLPILGGASFWRWYTLREDLRGGSVSIAGKVQFRKPHARGGAFVLAISTQTFRIGSKEVFLAFYHNKPYHIYYVPRTKCVLSAEPIEPSS